MTVALLGSVLTPSAYAQNYDLSADFSATKNPNGVWSYGKTTSLGGTFNLNTQAFKQGGLVDAWKGAPTDFPFVARNGSGNPQVAFGYIPLANGQTFAHPSAIGEYSVFRWTAPANGLFVINASFGHLDTKAQPTDTADVHVLYNGVPIFSGAVSLGADAAASPSLSQVMRAGDTLDFAVGYGAEGRYNYDSTSVAATVAYVVPTYDVSADFSATSNPNGAWSYGRTPTLGGAFSLNTLGLPLSAGLDAWKAVPDNSFPFLAHNASANPQLVFGHVPLASGQVVAHPSASGEYSVFRWTAPADGTVVISSSFGHLDPTAGPTDTEDVHVLYNGQPVFSGVVSLAAATISSTNLTQAVRLGDTVDFAIGYGAEKSYGFDSTSVAASIKYKLPRMQM